MTINEDTLKMYLDRMFKPWVIASKQHWHPCCQEHPDAPLNTPSLDETSEVTSEGLIQYKCPRGHAYEAPEPFILTTPDLACNSGPICVYCYVTWLQVNLGTEEFVVRD